MLDRFTTGIERLGESTIEWVEDIGGMFIMFVKAVIWAFRPPFRFRVLLETIESVGV
ncbi:MAG: hypothetical protein ABEL76_16985, partial [Bradymonadaceae bacterium]